MIDIQKERAAFEVYAKSRIENFCDCKFEHGNYVMLENSRLNRLDKYLLICSMNRSWSAWQAVKAQAVPEGFVLVPTKNVNYFSNDGESYEIHKTLAEAKHEAECAIEHYSDRLADQECDPSSDGSFNQIGYGVILAESSYTVDHVVTQDDIDKGNYSYDVGTEIMSLHLIEAQEQSS